MEIVSGDVVMLNRNFDALECIFSNFETNSVVCNISGDVLNTAQYTFNKGNVPG